MNNQRSWQDYSNEEKLIAINAYLDGIVKLDANDAEVNGGHIEWLRQHLPAYKTDGGKNFVFISYSHRDFAKVYNDLATFLYNSDKTVRFWYDEGLPAGKNWAEEAKKYIEHPNCVGAIFYLSKNLLRSPAVMQEIELITATGKPYVSIALNQEEYSAESIFKNQTEGVKNYALLNKVFPNEDTALVYDGSYENVLYRINKIEEAFNVTEDVMSDFVCEEFEDGLCLVEYRGNKTDVFIPEKINDKSIVAVQAEFNNAASIFVPHTVRYLLPTVLAEDEYEDLAQQETATMNRLLEKLIGGYQKLGAIFGEADSLEIIRVDDRNQSFYDKDGALYSREGEILRVPPKMEFTDSVLEGVKKIGYGAFYGCYCAEDFYIPDGVEIIDANAFANSVISLMGYGATLTEMGESAFANATIRFPIVDITSPLIGVGDWAYKNAGGIEMMSFAEDLLAVGRGAFFGSSVQLVTFPNSLQLICDGAFASCSNLDYVSLGNSLLAIGANAFNNCDKMLEIELPASLTFIGAGAFDNCSALKYVYFAGTRKQFNQIQIEQSEELPLFLEKVVCKDELFKRIKTKYKRVMRKFAENILEKY